MNHLKIICLLVCLLPVPYGRAQERTAKTGLHPMTWLVGTWKQQTPRGEVYETWTLESGDHLSGKSYAVKGRDTLIYETVQLVQKEDGIYYIPTVNNKAGTGKPVPFKLSVAKDGEMVFDNPEHDFPQRISYRRTSENTLLAVISGTIGGQVKSQEFPMSKVP